MKLETSLKDFEALHEIAEGRGKRPIPVTKAILGKLLIDHSRMYKELYRLGKIDE